MALKKQIILHMEELEHTPETSFEKDVVCEDEDSFCLSTENITSLKLLICHVSVTFCPAPPAPASTSPGAEWRVPAEASSLEAGVFLLPQLEERKAENEATCEAHREKIQQLWDRLKVPEEERGAFNQHMVSSKKRNLEAVSSLFCVASIHFSFCCICSPFLCFFFFLVMLRSSASGGAEAAQHPQRDGRHSLRDGRALGQELLQLRAEAGLRAVLQR